MVTSFFNLISALLGLADHTLKNVATKIDEASPTIKSKIDEASTNIRSKYGDN